MNAKVGASLKCECRMLGYMVNSFITTTASRKARAFNPRELRSARAEPNCQFTSQKWRRTVIRRIWVSDAPYKEPYLRSA